MTFLVCRTTVADIGYLGEYGSEKNKAVIFLNSSICTCRLSLAIPGRMIYRTGVSDEQRIATSYPSF